MSGLPRQLRDDARGLALVEFAMVLPFMLILYLGGFQISDGIACSRKVTIATRALADLVTQSVDGTTSKSEIDSNLAAAAQVMAPFSSSAATERITELYTDATLKTTVVWSRGLNTTGYTAGAVATLPTNIRVANSYLIFSEIGYAYKPPVTFNIVQPMNFTSNLYMLPRNTTNITCGDC